jgi:hypothetical protein
MRLEEMEDNSREFVRRRCDCLSWPEFALHPSEEFAQIVVGMVEGMRRKPQGESHPVLDGSGPHIENLPAADLLFWAKTQPGGKCRSVAELGEIRTYLTEDRVGSHGADARNVGQVDAKDPV